MGAIPEVPATVRTRDQLASWIDRTVDDALATNLPARLRFLVAVMDRAAEIRAASKSGAPATSPAGAPAIPSPCQPETTHER
ncbi:hypothetical protein CA223_05315 [Sphingomonas koreensis]|uniref:Uncharacterized protein n=2 Tax=Sphingomonas koreensis TaxID=93064 RepID=A0A1L6JBQ0_9SPHN|nr:hypothetical protein [Sphingomonas koreensis]APR53335.1 hypothetical protein BRX40_13670 [Sphingomonas koreensis]MDC7809975.1 hypothetical protein [Sphingomonas koreensis]RSU24545.1 hypothetical protein CA224_02165 [Sphingomonas koreensis]RSU25190.1 hypothetical protein CA222_13760 [Sphingomonas koreensis]RSU30135.1 hypothetical protein CA225_05590 [Sphingomonas koreensis]